jgi:hypothetical protein
MVAAGLAVCAPGAPAGPKKPKHDPEPTGTLTADWPVEFTGPKFVLVSLYREGELVRSRELRPVGPAASMATPFGALAGPGVRTDGPAVTWKGLPCGIYDVCFEARGYARGAKRVRVSREDGEDLVVHVELGEQPYQIGDGLHRAAKPAPDGGAMTADAVLAGWVQSQQGVRTLLAEFDLVTRHESREVTKTSGTFRLFRGPAGQVAAACDIRPPDGSSSDAGLHGLLTDGRLYLVRPERKEAVRLAGADADPLGFLARHLVPQAALLDPARVVTDCRLEVTAQDEWYTVLSVRPQKPTVTSWFPARYTSGRVVLMNRDGKTLPKGAVRQVWFTDGELSSTYEVRSWRANPADGPTTAEFLPPEKRDGWTVSVWPPESGKR